MSEVVLSNQNPVFSAACEVQQICTPIKEYLGINTFSYVKINPDLSRIHLDTNPIWNEFFYNNVSKYVQQENLIEASHWHEGYSTLFALKDPCIPDAVQFNVGDGVVIANEIDDCTELCFFATDHDITHHQLLKLLSSIDLLHKFISYFRVKAEKIIKAAEKSPIYLPNHANVIQEKKVFPIQAEKAEFINRLESDRNINLTTRERECLNYLQYDLSAKQIGDLLGIHTKTVERHFENLRNKFKVNKTRAILKLANMRCF